MIILAILVTFCIAMGITAGAHRLWSHRAYKAKWPLRFVLMLLQTTAFQVNFYFFPFSFYNLLSYLYKKMLKFKKMYYILKLISINFSFLF